MANELPPLTDAEWEEINERAANDEGVFKRLVEMRGGCRCCISPPCSACCEPLTMAEADRLGLLPEPAVQPDFSSITRAFCG